VDRIEVSTVRLLIERLRGAGTLPATTLVGTDRDRQEAQRVLDGLPPNGELCWHGADGRPCPCLSCSSTNSRSLDANGLIKMPAKEPRR
jgi:hypothetical protein